MKSIGSLLLFLGVGTIVLNLFGYEFMLLSWIDNWGEGVGWAIRGVVIVAGGILFLLGWKAEKGEAAEGGPEAPQGGQETG